MANNTFVGFPNGQGESGVTAADTCHELQPITTWDRQGYYTITRRWRGPIDALKNFSQGGVNNKDHDGTYLSGANGIIPGGAGRDGAIKTDLQRDEGGQTGILNGPGALTGRGATSGDQYQESSLWFLDGNDLEKNIYESDIVKTAQEKLNAHTTETGNGFAARLRLAITNYQNGKDKNGTALADPYQKKFDLSDYFNGVLTILAGQASITGGTNLQTDVESLCEDILKGQEGFTVSQFVLRNTKTTQYNSALTPHYANVNRIWTTANITTLMAGETRPIDPPTSTVANTLPLLGVLGTLFSTSKWLYRTPDVQQLGDGKWQITKEWFEGDEISTNTYKTYGVA